MAQKIDLKISYGKHRIMGTLDKISINNLLKGRQIASVGMSDDGAEIFFDMSNHDRLTFRIVQGKPTFILGNHPNSVNNWDLPTFKDYQS